MNPKFMGFIIGQGLLIRFLHYVTIITSGPNAEP